MNFAVLGTDAEILQLLAAARDAGHQITWLGNLRSEDTPAIASLVANATDRGASGNCYSGKV